MSVSTHEMSSQLEHFSHPKHPLILKEWDTFGDDTMCSICNNTVVGSPTYTCSSPGDDIKCRSFYLHKSCAELPTQINFYKHNQHPLDLQRRTSVLCDACDQIIKFSYACYECDFDVCVICAFEQRVLRHEGHQEHTLTLIQRESLFTCDACCEEDKDSSYICTICDFWIHKKCAFSPLTILAPTYHHHPLNLIYSVPKMHRYFQRRCYICKTLIAVNFWLYYCHKCTYFVHMKCATSSHTVSTVNEIEAEGIDEDLVEFPLHSEESFLDFIITQCCKIQVEYQGKGEENIAPSVGYNDPHIIKKHWSHEEHPLVQIQFTRSKNDNDDNDYDRRLLFCNGCIQPITVSHPSYYACIQCGFFLHSFCATKLPEELQAGTSPPHSQHSLLLCKKYKYYNFVKCGVCCWNTNGFYYRCETCDINIDMRCAFLPSKIKHKSHEHHSLIQRPSSKSGCKVSHFLISGGLEYGCETCTDFQISIMCTLYPSKMEHRYDDHPVTLRLPPFFYEGVFYCEICEEQVDNQFWLYHCGECDHSFHHDCIGWLQSVKLGATIEIDINYQPHRLALVLKNRAKKKKTKVKYYCENCRHGYKWSYFWECDGCGYRICSKCVTQIKGCVTSTL